MDAVTVETPIPLVDLDRLDRNLERMADYASQHRLSLRPHSKTHKSQRIAAEQIRRGAVGLTCATILEMEVMAEASTDLLLAYPAVGEAKLQRLLSLPDEIAVTVMLDSHDAAEQLAAAARKRDRELGVLVELDAGMHRVGVSGVDAAVGLARTVTRLPALAYRGIGFYPGHLRTAGERQE